MAEEATKEVIQEAPKEKQKTEKVKKQKTDSVLLIDIGTASVGAAFLSKSKNKLPLISDVKRVPVGSGSTTSKDALLTHTEEALKALLKNYTTTIPKEINVIVSAPWHDASIRSVNSTSKKVAHISRRTALAAIQKYQNEKPPQGGSTDVEAVAVQIQVNGYNTMLQNMVTGTSISINLYESEMRSDIERAFTQLIQSNFPHAKISYNTFPLVSTIALRSLTPQTGFTVVDVTGETTEITILHNDGVHYLASFPIGFQTIARSLSTNEDGIGDALSRLSLFARDELSETELQVMETSFTSAFAPWTTAFESALKDASETIPIPQTLFLLTDRDPSQWLKKGIERQNTYSVTVTVVNAPVIQNHLEVGPDAAYDVFLSLAALFYTSGKQEILGEADDLDVV